MRASAQPRGASGAWAAVVCFVVGTGAGAAVLWGEPRPVAGDGSWGVPAAIISGVITSAAFVISTLLHRRGETAPMPRWQAVVSDISAIALTIAFAAVTATGVLLTGEILAVGMQGLALSAVGGGLLIGVAAAVGGRFAFGAGVGLRTSDLSELLLVYLVIGTLFAMLTAADPRWWERNFSALGVGAGSWAFNGTVIVAGLLVGTVGSYIGRDLHRVLGDGALDRIAWVVVLWVAVGAALAAVGLIPINRAVIAHNIAAFGAMALFVVAGVVTVVVMPRPPRTFVIATVATMLLVAIAFVLGIIYRIVTVTALEVIIVGLGLLWMSALVQALAALAPDGSRPSARRSLVRT